MRKKIRIFADFIDPFCYIGFINLTRAQARMRGSRWRLEWCGFELNPSTPPEGMDLLAAGNSDLRPGLWSSIGAYAARSGIEVKPPDFVPNTRHALQLVESAPRDVKIPLITRIYQAYLSGRRNIGDPAVLTELAERFGVSRPRVEASRSSAGAARRIEAHRDLALKHRFPGLPGFQAGGRRWFGALSVESWEKILKE